MLKGVRATPSLILFSRVQRSWKCKNILCGRECTVPLPDGRTNSHKSQQDTPLPHILSLSYLVGSKGHETVKIFYADANARITQNRGFDGRTICDNWARIKVWMPPLQQHVDVASVLDHSLRSLLCPLLFTAHIVVISACLSSIRWDTQCQKSTVVHRYSGTERITRNSSHPVVASQSTSTKAINNECRTQ